MTKEDKTMQEIDEAGFVYLVATPDRRRVKVGYSTDPILRLRQLQTGSHERLRLLNFMPAGQHFEEAFHKVYAGRRLVGEWFRDDDGVIRKVFDGLAARARAGEVLA